MTAAVEKHDSLPAWAADDPRYRQLLSQFGDSGRAAEEFGLLLHRERNFSRAVEALRAAASLAPDQPQYWNNLGVALYENRDPNGAIDAMRRSLAVNDDQPQTYINIAGIQRSMGRLEEAEENLIVAAKSPQTMVEAWTGIGHLRFARLNHPGAIEAFNRAIATGGNDPNLFGSLGAALFQSGKVIEAAAAYREAATRDPATQGFKDNTDFLTMLAGITAGRTEAAVSAYARPLTEDATLISAFRRAMSYLAFYRMEKQAKDLVLEWLQYYPEDTEAQYFNAVLSGKKLASAPHDYIARQFNEVAAIYEPRLVTHLEYRLPEKIAALLARHLRKGWKGDILDIGCGTGLMAKHLEPYAKTLRGVDLSPRMLEVAANKGYSALVNEDAVAFMQNHPSQFDMVTAADVFIHTGALEPVFTAAARTLKPGGYFVFSIETLNRPENYLGMVNGRFRHRTSYVEAVGRAAFIPIERLETAIRKERGEQAPGAIFLFQRR